MQVHSPRLSAGFMLLIAAMAFAGLLLELRPWVLGGDWLMFRFFTNLTNLGTAIYFTIAGIRLATGRDSILRPWLPTVKGACMMALVITMSVVAAGGFPDNGTAWYALLLVHVLVPCSAVAHWLVFDAKGWMSRMAPLWWMLFPILYVCWTVFSNWWHRRAGIPWVWPYPFLNVDLLGVGTVAVIVMAMAIGFTFVGYLFREIDQLLAALRLDPRHAPRGGASDNGIVS